MKKILCLCLCLALALPMFGCGMKPEEYTAPVADDPIGTFTTENTYTSTALNLAITLPANVHFTDERPYNTALLLNGGAKQCEFFAAGEPQRTSLQIMLTTEAAPDTQDLAEWLKAEGRMAADAEVVTFPLLEQEYMLITKAGNVTTWQLYRVVEDKLILLQLQAMEQEYTLEQIAWLFYPADGVTSLPEQPILKAVTFKDEMGNGKTWRRQNLGAAEDYNFRTDGTMHLVGGLWFGDYGEQTHTADGTYQVFGNIVYMKYRKTPSAFEGMPPTESPSNHEMYAIYNPQKNTLFYLTGTYAGQTHTFFLR